MANDTQKLQIACVKFEALWMSLEKKCKDLEKCLLRKKEKGDELVTKLKEVEVEAGPTEKLPSNSNENADTNTEDKKEIAALTEALQEKELALHKASVTIEEHHSKCGSLEVSLDISTKENNSHMHEIEDIVIVLDGQ